MKIYYCLFGAKLYHQSMLGPSMNTSHLSKFNTDTYLNSETWELAHFCFNYQFEKFVTADLVFVLEAFKEVDIEIENFKNFYNGTFSNPYVKAIFLEPQKQFQTNEWIQLLNNLIKNNLGQNPLQKLIDSLNYSIKVIFDELDNVVSEFLDTSCHKTTSNIHSETCINDIIEIKKFVKDLSIYYDEEDIDIICDFIYTFLQAKTNYIELRMIEFFTFDSFLKSRIKILSI